MEKVPGRGELEAKEKKVKILEHQRREVRMGLGRSTAVSRVGVGDGHVWLGQREETGTVWGNWDRAAEPPRSAAGAGIFIQLVPKVLLQWEAAGDRHGWLGDGVGLPFSCSSVPTAAGGE